MKEILRLHGVPFLSYQIVVPNSLPSFGENCMMNWADMSLLVKPFICSQRGLSSVRRHFESMCDLF